MIRPPSPVVVWPCGKERSKSMPQISGATSEPQSTRFSFMASFHAHIIVHSLQVPLDWHQLIGFRGRHFSLHITYIESFLEVEGKKKWAPMIHRLRYESVGRVYTLEQRVAREFEFRVFHGHGWRFEDHDQEKFTLIVWKFCTRDIVWSGLRHGCSLINNKENNIKNILYQF